jgi:NADH-quinone oxidoreductase subunit M
MENSSHIPTVDDGVPEPGGKYLPTGLDTLAQLLFFIITIVVLLYCFVWTHPLKYVLTKIVFLPFVGIFLNALIPKGNSPLIKANTLVYTIIPFILSVMMIGSYSITEPGMQYEENRDWILITSSLARTPSEQEPGLMQMDYHVGVDGISFPLLVLTTLLSTLAVVGSWGISNRVKEYCCWFLLLEVGMLGTFVALNYILFYLFWEMMLVPMYFLIGIWGGPRREYAAIKFFLYTLFGSIFLLLGILYLYFSVAYAKGTDFVGTWDILELQELAPTLLSMKAQKIIWLAFFLGFAIKVPIFPFHTWLPDAHVEAPTAVSVILAGILLKMGTYGFLRFSYPTFPEASHYFIPFMGILAAINIVYGAMVAMAQSDLKKLVAYSSIGHMGFVILGFASMTDLGYVGAQFQVISHGIISGALFLIVGVIYDKAHVREIDLFGGIAKNMRFYALITGVASMANLGLPGLSGFWGEFMSLYGAFQAEYMLASGFNLMRVLVVISAFGIIITAGYMLWMYQRIFLGPLNEKWAKLKDMDYREGISLVPLVVLMLFLGIYPQPLLNLYQATMGALVERLSQYAPVILGG